MTGPPLLGSSAIAARPSDDRLDSWKEIAAYMKRDVTTVQRWEKREGMPVHRHVHDKMGSVYAFKTDLDAWARGRSLAVAPEPDSEPTTTASPLVTPVTEPARPWRTIWIAPAALAAVAAFAFWQLQRPGRPPGNPLADARFSRLTDFDGIEQNGAISRDGRFVAFLSDRDGQMDVWVTQVGVTGWNNLTDGRVRDLTNPSVRTPSFSPDGTHVTFWVRRPEGTSVWAVPVLGGPLKPYLEGFAEFDWSSDGGRLVYHTSADGDPTYIREADPSSESRLIFTAPRGLHAHFQMWSPDHAFIYFVQGTVPDRMDIWRVRPDGGATERITNHDSHVSHPVFWNSRTVLYLAGNRDGAGPWIHSVDVDERVPRRISTTVDRYTSLSASADGRRLVATLANPKGTLWRVPVVDRRADMSSVHRIPLMTGNGSTPRLGSGQLLYVASTGTGDSVWTQRGNTTAEVWSAPGARIIGAPALASKGGRMAFVVSQNGQTLLQVANVDGTDARVLTRSLELQGAPAWTPDGQAITVAAVLGGVPRLHIVPLDGSPPTPLTEEHSVDPAWSPDGEFVAFSGPDIGTMFEVKALKRDGSPHPLPALALTRGARHLAVLPGGQLMVLRGEIRHKNLWLIDLNTGHQRQLTDFAPDVAVRDFDVSSDGREIVFEQVQEQSDIVLLEVPE